MKNTLIQCSAVLALCFFVACNNTPPPSSPAQLTASAAATPVALTGYLYKMANEMKFVPCSGEQTYIVLDTAQKAATRMAANPMSSYQCPGEPVWAALSGTVMGNQLTIQKLDSVSSLNKFNACLGFEYICSGTEPFWNLIISPKENVAYLKDISQETGYTLRYAAPQIQNGTVQYTLTHIAQPNETMTVTIKKEKCSDGMSDIDFQYSALIRFKGKELRGCAEKYGELMKTE